MRALLSTMLLWALLVAPALGFECTFTPQDKDIARFATMLTDVEIGQWAVGAMKRYHGVLTDGDLVERVNTIADRLRQVVRKRPEILYTVEVLDTREQGACAYPGGYVVVTKGLIAQAADDHELSMVIAHEFAHIAAGQMDNPLAHELPARLQQRLRESGAIGRGFMVEMRNHVCADITADEIRKVHELQADERAVVYMFLAGYRPTAALTILNKVSAEVTSSCQPSRSERQARISRQVQGILDRLEQFHAGVRFYVQQEYERAIEAFRIFLSSGYDGREVYHNLATAYHRLALRAQGQSEQVHAKCSIALEADTRASRLRLRDIRGTGNTAAFQRYLTEAIKQYTQALEQEPQYAPAATNLACAYLAQERYGTAQDELQQVLRVHPEYVAAYNNLGVAFLLQHEYPRAVEQLEQAIRRVPRYADPYCNLAFAWDALGHAQRARSAWQRYLELGSAGPTLCAQQARAQLGLQEDVDASSTLAAAERQVAPGQPGQLRAALPQAGREVPVFLGCPEHVGRPCAPVQAVVDEGRGVTLLVEGQMITQVVLTSPTTQATAKGIRVGASMEQVWQRYGPPTRLEETPTGPYLVYDQAKLAFALRDGRVVSWFLF